MIAERERDDIGEWLDDLLTEWVEHTSTREKGEQLANRVRILFRQSRSAKPAVGRFAKYERPVDAVLDILDEAGHALPPEEIKAAVLAGQFRAWKPGKEVAVDIDKCLGAYAPDAKKGRKALRWVGGSPDDDGRWTGGLIGRGEWPDERFM